MTAFHLTPDKPKTRRQRSGTKAFRVGEHFQAVIRFSALGQKGIVQVHELPRLGAKWARGADGRMKLVPTKICCDFVGGFAGGVGFYFDAKSPGPAEHGLPEGMIPRHQVQFLRAMSEADQIAGFLVEARAVGEYLWIDIASVHDWESIPYTSRAWLHLGPNNGTVDFSKIRASYV